MALLQQQMARLCRRLKMHRILSSSSSNKHLTHGRSLKESSSGEFFSFWLFNLAGSLSLYKRRASPQIKAYSRTMGVIINKIYDMVYYGGVTIYMKVASKGKIVCRATAQLKFESSVRSLQSVLSLFLCKLQPKRARQIDN